MNRRANLSVDDFDTAVASEGPHEHRREPGDSMVRLRRALVGLGGARTARASPRWASTVHTLRS
jgi:hypothetical protein